jgi:hypothetical protein
LGRRFKRILIIADIEGSSGCWNYRASSFMTPEWARACVEMSRDVSVVVKALLDAGVEHISIKDFHRTGYNLLCYLTPLMEKTLPFSLFIYNFWGRIGLAWVRRQIKRIERKALDS